jgi:4-hydroxy-tetrahydrodipicolinate synthase
MNAEARLCGVWSAAITPVTAEFAPDLERAVAYYSDLLRDGCDGLNLMGTTGEAMSFGVRQRLGFIEGIAASGLPMQRVMFGTGAASLDDAARLMRAAFAARAAAALVMPPFFFRDASDDGIVRFFDALLSRAYVPGKRVLLYNFPRMSGVTFHAALVDRLVTEFPEAIAGMKDSSNDAALQRDVLAVHPELAVFPGTEDCLIDTGARGTAGCISGTVALWPKLAHEVLYFDELTAAPCYAELVEASERLVALRRLVCEFPIIPAVRHLVARARSDDAWERAMPPNMPLKAQEAQRLDAASNDSALHV